MENRLSVQKLKEFIKQIDSLAASPEPIEALTGFVLKASSELDGFIGEYYEKDEAMEELLEVLAFGKT